MYIGETGRRAAAGFGEHLRSAEHFDAPDHNFSNP